MWYECEKTLSYNKLFNFVVGPRGVGKTYSCKRRVIKNYLKKGSQFVYLRRYDTEIKTSQIDKFFDDIHQEFPQAELKVSGKAFLCDDEVMGWALPLSKAGQFKSIPFPNVSLIIFDEFIIDQGMIRYLPNEVNTFLEMYSTIARMRDVPVLFLSNAITFTNPYFLYFDLRPPKNKEIEVKGDLLIQFVESNQYKDALSNTRFGRLISNTNYGRYAIENEFAKDNNNFVCKMPNGMKCRAIIVCDGKELGLYSGRHECWFVSDSFDKTCKLRITTDNSSMDEETLYKLGPVIKQIWYELQQRYYVGKLRFTSIKAKNLVCSKLINIWR